MVTVDRKPKISMSGNALKSMVRKFFEERGALVVAPGRGRRRIPIDIEVDKDDDRAVHDLCHVICLSQSFKVHLTLVSLQNP